MPYPISLRFGANLALLMLVNALVIAGVFVSPRGVTADADNPASELQSAGTQTDSVNYTKSSAASTQDAQLRTDIGKVLRRYELAKLNQGEARNVVTGPRTLVFEKQNGALQIELVPHDIRAAVYRAEEVGAGGKLHPVKPLPVNTYKGFVSGREGSTARFTIDEKSIDGLVMMDGEHYFVEPARRYSSTASPSDFVVYNSADVNQASEGRCGVTLSDKIDEHVARLDDAKALGPVPSAATSRVVEMATEADVEYVTFAGGSAQANNEILGVMNQVDGIFSAEIGVRITIVYQHSWATENDPYTSMSTPTTLDQFTNYWNANLSSVPRDLAHMFTTRSLNDYAGFAWITVVCNSPNQSYAVSFRRNWRLATLVAHEMGHNFGATHIDTTYDCSLSIMESGAGYATSFCGFSRTQINNHITNHGACLATGGSCNYALASSTQSHSANQGTGVVNVTAEAGCAWLATSMNSWISLDGVGNPDSPTYLSGNGPASFGYFVQQNTGFLRKGFISVAGRRFTVTQEGVFPDCASTPIQVGQTVNGQLVSSDCNAMWKQPGTYAKKYSFAGVAGQQVQITMNAVYEPFLYLTAPDGSLVASSNSFLSATSVSIPAGNNMITLPATGMYIIEATSWRDRQEGAFTLLLTGTCGYSAAPTVHSLTSVGGNGTVNVTANAGCGWPATVATGNTWLTINSGHNGVGNGGVNFTVAANHTNSARTGTLNVAGQTITINQAAPSLVLLTEDGTNRAIAIDSVTWVRDPFSLLATNNLSSDQRTRVTLFAINLVLNPGENASAVTAQAIDAQQNTYPLVVEYLGSVQNLTGGTQLVIKLSDALSSLSEIEVWIRLHGSDSNRVLLKLKP